MPPAPAAPRPEAGRFSMQIEYLLEDTALFGGVKIALHQANLLQRRGHRVRVLSKGPAPAWFALEAEFEEVPDLAAAPGRADVTVATFWTTIAPAMERAAGEVVHYCQGFEASYTHNADEHPRIENAYSRRLPALALAPHLANLVRERFGRPARVVYPALEAHWSPRAPRRESRLPRILVSSPFEIDWKGVPTALRALGLLRDQGVGFELVRLSQWPQSDEERALLHADEFHCHLPSAEVPALVRSCDLALAPSWEQEGFGLPVLESMACGVPVIAGDVSCFRDFAAGAAVLVPPLDHVGFAAAARRLLGDDEDWRRRSAAGAEIARRFREERIAAEAEEALLWVAGGDWRREPRDPG